MTKSNAEKIVGFEVGVLGLEQDVTKIREEGECTRKENVEHFAEVLQAISNLTKTIMGKNNHNDMGETKKKTSLFSSLVRSKKGQRMTKTEGEVNI